MRGPSREELDALWAHHHAEWRDPAQIVGQWQDAGTVDPQLLRFTARGAWWDALAAAGITLLVTREYEHLILAIRAPGGRPDLSYTRLPHPSGLAIDRDRGIVHVASTRNPNQVYDWMPTISDFGFRISDLGAKDGAGSPFLGSEIRNPKSEIRNSLVPVRSRFLPGRLYLHDLAVIGGELYANAVGQNAIVRLHEDGRHERVWWPRCIETEAGPEFDRNYLQLNSIAAGADLAASYFSASADRISSRRPGHRNFPVDRRGVLFSGATREPVARGLTRPHSARLHGGRVWVDNSGYGEVGFVAGEAFTPVARLPGWTRGLCFHGDVAFVGTSRVIPRFRQYAPGLDLEASLCGLHAVETGTGKLLGSLIWPYGNQIFAIDWLPETFSTGFPFRAGARRATEREKRLFYDFRTAPPEEVCK